jgi:hypothetical protein
MNRCDIEQLQGVRDYPCISILMPTHRHRPENRQDPIRLANLVSEAKNRLLEEMSQREAAPLLLALEKQAEAVPFQQTLDGLVIFVGATTARTFLLPFRLEERVIVDSTFATRDLVFALNRTHRYWVLALSEKPTRLFEGTNETLIEVTDGGFPMVHEGPGGELPLPGGAGVKKSAYRDEQHRQFFRKVDESFAQLWKSDPLPLMVVGVDRYLSFFRELSRHSRHIISTMTGSHDRTTPHELGKLVWPLVEQSLAAKRLEYLQDLDDAVGAKKAASALGQAWRRAHEGRGALLLVEEGYRCPGILTDDGAGMLHTDDPNAPGVIPDAVDELIELVMAKGGQVVFVAPGSLAVHQQVALILRY